MIQVSTVKVWMSPSEAAAVAVPEERPLRPTAEEPERTPDWPSETPEAVVMSSPPMRSLRVEPLVSSKVHRCVAPSSTERVS